MLKQKEMDALIKHYNTFLGNIEALDYTPAKDMPIKPQLLLSKKNKYRPYNIVTTVGLSEYKLRGTYSNCELMVLLDENWKFKLNNSNNNWPIELIYKIANALYLTDAEFGYGQYFINEGNKTFCPMTDMGVALIAVPAMLEKSFFELKMGKKSVNFFVITTATFDELKLIKHLGGVNFIQRYLLPEGEGAFVIRNNKL